MHITQHSVPQEAHMINQIPHETPSLANPIHCRITKTDYKFIYNVLISNIDSSGTSLREPIFEFVKHLLLYKRATSNFIEPLEKATHNMQAQILCAIYCLYNGKSPRPFLQQCNALKKQKKANLREKWLFQAVRAWFEGSLDKSIEIHTKIAEKYPKDILSLYLCFNHYVYVHNTDRMVHLFKLVEQEMHDEPFFLGMYCFALAEAKEIQAAHEMGSRSYAILPENPWAHHSLSHVFQELGKYDEGIAFMEKNSIYWEDCIPFMYSHNWWHVAMLYLAKCHGPQDPILNRIETILDKYTWHMEADSESKRVFNSDITVLAGVIGLLWELDLNGFTTNESLISQDFFQKLWLSILPFVQEKTKVHVYPFFDIHFVYALARVGDMDNLQAFVHSIEEYGAHWKKPYLVKAWGKVLPAASKGVVSFVLGDYTSAFHYLDPVHKDLPLLGGSNPQRLPMDETYIRCCLYHGEILLGVEALTPTKTALGNGCVTQFPRCALMVENSLHSETQNEDGGSDDGSNKRSEHVSLKELATLAARVHKSRSSQLTEQQHIERPVLDSIGGSSAENTKHSETSATIPNGGKTMLHQANKESEGNVTPAKCTA
mmetsp:Transcript_3515/g.13453  ORF Transcript_3515/g.13453 Transcript_3515/m.13453 type:complete len:601 (-) Transcript_3515:174-1976(-)|eukprot:CAMPEP_0117443366 /NCGR_PEP_ID=MMETSP0759-20121206/4658_1 /TAXON_ID=63605 /ORGANISM="Percolomonas cosmopolitus, Strain WS" /LENGTH=600 /DNA_ID=CAMNT_0005235339 /DNA_START=213 /DNA_END=2015 /DNA_ORIENTATION=+